MIEEHADHRTSAEAPETPIRPTGVRSTIAMLALFVVVVITALADLSLNFLSLSLDAIYVEYDAAHAGPIAFVAGRALLLAVAIFATLTIARLFRRMGRPAGAGALLAVAVLLLISEGIGAGASVRRLPLALDEASAIAAMDPFELRYEAATGVLAIRGNITPGLTDAILEVEKASGPLRAIEITSDGGLVDEALAVADIIRQRGLTVIVRETCASACIILAVASPEAYAEEGLNLGLHAIYALTDDQSETSIYAAEQARLRYRDFLLAKGLSEELLEEADEYGPDELLLVPAEDLVHVGIMKGLVARRS
ncbi:hypothetical protein C3941_25145 [Kaistia algarum]|uniref:hypothetical protein n=1 Tax=Kaistia algarum TaxID=2083279 RepID=UPI000CE75CB9|nr:hypothetical protein [Kaistia algarum]MCX5516107.1 hypothetical protein [Kaistia algarum]PPE77158.1 hypothetical protein C3941_25145 [Kaistia algarum]